MKTLFNFINLAKLVLSFAFISVIMGTAGLSEYTLPVFGAATLAMVLVPTAGFALSLITAADLTFNGEEVRSFADAVLAKAFEKPSINDFHTIVDGIVAKKQIAILGRISKITKKDAGCGNGKLTNQLGMTEKFWDPQATKIWVSECHTQFEATFMVYLKKKGIDIADFTGTDIANFIVEVMTDAALEDAFRIAWFNDTAALNVADAGVITDGVSLTDYTIIDGFWKQVFAIVAADATKKVAITENAAASYALQDTLAATRARDVYSKLQTSADYRLQGAPDKVIISTMSLLNNYMDYLESIAVPASFEYLESGFPVLKRRGVAIIGFNFWDRTIRADFDNGTKWNLPHRAILTTATNLQIGLDKKEAIGEFDIFYDKMTETSNFKGGYKVDAKIVEDYMIQAAY